MGVRAKWWRGRELWKMEWWWKKKVNRVEGREAQWANSRLVGKAEH